MRRSTSFVIAAAALLCAPEARAQFANKSLGVFPGYMRMNADPTVDWALPLSFEGSLYVESGFDLVIRVAPMLVTEKLLQHQMFGASFALGVRYLLSEESLRPYVGANLAGLYFDRADNKGYGGVGAFAGLDYFVSDSVSLGARAFANFYLELNQPVTEGVGVQGGVATYF